MESPRDERQERRRWRRRGAEIKEEPTSTPWRSMQMQSLSKRVELEAEDGFTEAVVELQ